MSKKIILVTGARGTGKSTALAGLVPATKEAWEQTLVFDTEDSWSDLVYEDEKKKGIFYLNVEGSKIKVGEFVRAYDRFKADSDLLTLIATGKLPWVSAQKRGALLDYYKYFIESLDKRLADSKFKYVLIDTIETPEAALSAWVETNREQSGWSGDKSYGRLETEGIRPVYENIIEGISRRGVEIVGLSSHLKQPWEGNKPIPNKVEPGGRLKLLARISTLMVWLVQEPKNEDGAPAALVLKARLSTKMGVEGGVLKPRRVLPERMPHFSWEDVKNYIKKPANFQSPAEGERMSEVERDMISEMMNDAQFKLMMLDAQQDLVREQASSVFAPMPASSTGELSLTERIRLQKLNGGTTE